MVAHHKEGCVDIAHFLVRAPSSGNFSRVQRAEKGECIYCHGFKFVITGILVHIKTKHTLTKNKIYSHEIKRIWEDIILYAYLDRCRRTMMNSYEDHSNGTEKTVKWSTSARVI